MLDICTSEVPRLDNQPHLTFANILRATGMDSYCVGREFRLRGLNKLPKVPQLIIANLGLAEATHRAKLMLLCQVSPPGNLLLNFPMVGIIIPLTEAWPPLASPRKDGD